MRRLVAVASVLLVAAVLALWRSRARGADRARGHEIVSNEAAPAVSPPVARGPVPARTLAVRVVDAATDAAVPGATVVAIPEDGERATAETDGNGEATMPAFRGEVLVEGRGYAPRRIGVAVDSSPVVMALRAGIPVGGRVVFAGTGAPVEGASVAVTDIDAGEQFAELVTDREGRFAVPGARPDAPLLFVAERAALAPVGRVERRAVPGEEIVLEMGGGAVIEGRVVRADGTAAAGADVVVNPRGGERLFPAGFYCRGPDYVVRTKADGAGAFRVEGLRIPASYTATATDDRFTTGGIDDIELRAGSGSASRVIVLAPRTIVAVTPVFPEGEPGQSIKVSLAPPGCRPILPLAGNDEAGWQAYGTAMESVVRPLEGQDRVFAPKEPGAYEVTVTADNFPDAHVPVEVREGVRNDLVVRMSREGHRVLEGIVVNEAGTPVRWTWASLKTSGATITTRTAADGRFHLCDVPDRGTLEISAWDCATWTREGVAPGAPPIQVVLRVAAWYTGRFDPVPRSVAVRVDECANVSDAAEPPLMYLSLDADGRFSIPCSADRGTSLAFWPDEGALLFLRPPTLAAGETHDLGVLRLGAGFDVEGTVRDDRGNPIADARVIAEVVSANTLTVYTDAGGRFRLEHLPDLKTNLFVVVEAPGFGSRTLEWVTAGGPELREITLVPTGVVEGVVLDADERPVAGWIVAARSGDDDLWTTTDSFGRFRADAAPGRYGLGFYEADGGPIVVRSGETTRVTLHPFRVRKRR